MFFLFLSYVGSCQIYIYIYNETVWNKLKEYNYNTINNITR